MQNKGKRLSNKGLKIDAEASIEVRKLLVTELSEQAHLINLTVMAWEKLHVSQGNDEISKEEFVNTTHDIIEASQTMDAKAFLRAFSKDFDEVSNIDDAEITSLEMVQACLNHALSNNPEYVPKKPNNPSQKDLLRVANRERRVINDFVQAFSNRLQASMVHKELTQAVSLQYANDEITLDEFKSFRKKWEVEGEAKGLEGQELCDFLGVPDLFERSKHFQREIEHKVEYFTRSVLEDFTRQLRKAG